MIRKIIAIIKKDFLIETSYRLAFILNIFSICTSLLIYYFIDKLFGSKLSPHLQEFGVNYFSYVLLGLAFFSYIGVGISSFSHKIRSEQMQGTLESLLLTPTKTNILILSMGLWNLVFATFNVVIYFGLGVLLFKIDFSKINILTSCLILILSILSLSSLGIISAAFTIIFKRGNPIAWVINTLEGLIAGVYFPITVMPAFLQFIARCFPITHAIRAMQLAVYQGYALSQLKKELLFLLIFSLILVPLSLKIFNAALNHARKNGTLGQY
ncbi:MAG: ABC transporter permease [Candidatus Omnitrophota bacterium]